MYDPTKGTIMNINISRRAAAIAAIAIVGVGGAACGSEKASDGVSPAAPAPAPQARISAHSPVSADSAERDGKADAKDRRVIRAPGGREIVIP
jgi:hypothetical protein